MSGSADVTSGIQKKYLTVDSAHFRKHFTDPASQDPYLTIQLPEPINHVHEMALQMAVIPNEFFNIREDNNRLDIGWIEKDGTNSQCVQLTIPVGLYTLDLLVGYINDNLLSTDDFPDGKKPAFARPTSLKATDTKLTTFSQTTGTSVPETYDAYMFLIHPAYATGGRNGSFRNSIAHRLGFSRNAAYTLYTAPEHDSGVWTNMPADLSLEIMQAAYTDPRNSIILSQNVPNDYKSKSSALSGTETYDALHIHCDLLSNSTLTTTNHNLGGAAPAPATVHRSDILATIPVNANIGSVIRYMRPSEHFFGHAISNHRPITHFKLWLTDDSGIPFRPHEMPDWLSVIEFTVVEHVPDIVKQVHELNQNKAFQSRHAPMHLV